MSGLIRRTKIFCGQNDHGLHHPFKVLLVLTNRNLAVLLFSERKLKPAIRQCKNRFLEDRASANPWNLNIPKGKLDSGKLISI